MQISTLSYITSYSSSTTTTMITAMMTNNATITPTTGPTALLPLLPLLSWVEACEPTIQYACITCDIDGKIKPAHLASFQCLYKSHSKRITSNY